MSVVVVGTSPSIYDEQRGSSIDRYDKVIRVGTFHIDGPYTGTKTDVICTRWARTSHEYYPSGVEMWVVDYGGDDQHVVSVRYQHLHDLLQAPPTLGVCAIDHAIHVFGITVDVCGITTDISSCHVITGQSWDRSHARFNSIHNIVGEYLLLKRWMCGGKIRLI